MLVVFLVKYFISWFYLEVKIEIDGDRSFAFGHHNLIAQHVCLVIFQFIIIMTEKQTYDVS